MGVWKRWRKRKKTVKNRNVKSKSNLCVSAWKDTQLTHELIKWKIFAMSDGCIFQWTDELALIRTKDEVNYSVFSHTRPNNKPSSSKYSNRSSLGVFFISTNLSEGHMDFSAILITFIDIFWSDATWHYRQIIHIQIPHTQKCVWSSSQHSVSSSAATSVMRVWICADDVWCIPFKFAAVKI